MYDYSNLEKMDIHLKVNNNVTITPRSLDHLNIKSMIWCDGHQPLLEGSIPSSVEKLSIPNLFLKDTAADKQIIKIPSSVTELSFLSNVNLSSSILPCNLTKLSLRLYPNSTLDWLPTTVKELEIYGNISIKMIPKSITKLTCSGFHDDDNMEQLPFNIKSLHLISPNFNGTCPPSTLEYLEFQDYHKDIFSV